MPMQPLIRKVASKADHARSVQVRTRVFVIWQGVPATREVDEHEDTAHYFVALIDDEAVGTVRWRIDKPGLAKLERLAVLDSVRGQGIIGEKLTQAVIDDIRADASIKKIKLGAQDHAIPFYEDFGFTIIGDGYMDGGTIPHHDMVLEIK